MAVVSKENPNSNLGTVRWYANWRRYTFWVNNETPDVKIFDRACLQEIVDFIEYQMLRYREDFEASKAARPGIQESFRQYKENKSGDGQTDQRTGSSTE